MERKKVRLAAIQTEKGTTEKESKKRDKVLNDAELELEFLSFVAGYLGDLDCVPESEVYMGLGCLLRHVQGEVRVAMGRRQDDRFGDLPDDKS